MVSLFFGWDNFLLKFCIFNLVLVYFILFLREDGISQLLILINVSEEDKETTFTFSYNTTPSQEKLKLVKRRILQECLRRINVLAMV